MAVPGTSKHDNPTRVAASALLRTGAGKLWGVTLYGGTDASSIKFKDALTDTGTEIYGIVAPFTDTDASAASTIHISLEDLGGIDFATGIYAVLAGTGAIAYVWWDGS